MNWQIWDTLFIVAGLGVFALARRRRAGHLVLAVIEQTPFARRRGP